MSLKLWIAQCDLLPSHFFLSTYMTSLFWMGNKSSMFNHFMFCHIWRDCHCSLPVHTHFQARALCVRCVCWSVFVQCHLAPCVKEIKHFPQKSNFSLLLFSCAFVTIPTTQTLLLEVHAGGYPACVCVCMGMCAVKRLLKLCAEVFCCITTITTSTNNTIIDYMFC